VRTSFTESLERIVGTDGVVVSGPARAAYECDGYTLERAIPDAVALPRTVDEVRRVVRAARDAGWTLVPRGAGTSLAGGCLASEGSLVVALTRLRAVETIDPENRQALVQAGLPNLALSRAVAAHRLQFAPDPSSQAVSTIGGNIANNSGGPHTLKVGVTSHHVLAVELVTPDGEVRWLGSRVPARGGPDLAGLTVGSEGTFGIVTRAWVRLVPVPERAAALTASFRSAREATQAVSALIASGVVPAAVEMMDRPILDALHQAFGMTFPDEAVAFLLVEVDGGAIAVEQEARVVEDCLTREGAFAVARARDEGERLRLWTARKRAF
jgi:glycolate oxidase